MAESSGAGGRERLRGLGDVAYVWGERAPREEVLLGLSAEGSEWEPMSARDFSSHVAGLAKGLIGVGVGAGDRIAVVARPGWECALVVLAAWVVRAAVVVVWPGVSAERLDYVLRDSDPAAVVLEDGRHAQVVASLGRELSDLARVWRLDKGGVEAIAAPGAYMDSTAVRFRREEQSPADVAAVVYPVSTVVRTRGVVLTHGGLLDVAESLVDRMAPAVAERRRGEQGPGAVGRVLVELGLWEPGALAALVACGLSGASVGFVVRGPRLRREVRTFAPKVLVCRPWLVERVYQAERAAAPRNGWDNVDTFNVATELAVEYDKAPRKGAWRRVSRAMYEWVFGRVREALGGHVRLVVCAGGGLEERLDRFFNGAGVPLVQAWGVAESHGVVAAGSPEDRRGGTVGRALGGVEVRPSGDGEVYVRGPGLFAGYRGDEEATRSAVWEGWLATGVAGSLDEAGFVSLGRRLRPQSSRAAVRLRPGGAGRGAVEPEPESALVWERRVEAHPLVSQAMVIGRGRPYASALVTLAGDQVEYWRLVNNRPLSMSRAELAADADLGAEIRSAVVSANHVVPPEWAVRAFHVLADEFTESNGLVLADGSLRRDAVLRAFAEEIEGLYRSRELPRGE